jgi:hypothetical protein
VHRLLRTPRSCSRHPPAPFAVTPASKLLQGPRCESDTLGPLLRLRARPHLAQVLLPVPAPAYWFARKLRTRLVCWGHCAVYTAHHTPVHAGTAVESYDNDPPPGDTEYRHQGHLGRISMPFSAHPSPAPNDQCFESIQVWRSSRPTNCTSLPTKCRTCVCSSRTPHPRHSHDGANGDRGARQRREPSSDEYQGCPWPARGETDCAARGLRVMQ